MKHTTYMLIASLLLTSAQLGCEKSSPQPAERDGTSTKTEVESEPTASDGPWRVGAIRVERAESPGDLSSPDESTVREWLVSALDASESLESTDAESNAYVSYRVAVIDGIAGVPADEQPFLRVRIQGQLTAPDRPTEVNELMALGIERDRSLDPEGGAPDEEQTRTIVREVVEEYVSIAEQRFAVLSAEEDELVDLLSSKSLPPEAALTAVHEARDRGVRDAVPAIIALLEHPSPTVVVAAAASLTQMAPDESATAIVEAAGRLGREREYASLHRLIFIIGDLEAPVAREYLEGLTGHQIPDIQRAAKQVLDRRQAETTRGAR